MRKLKFIAAIALFFYLGTQAQLIRTLPDQVVQRAKSEILSQLISKMSPF